MKVPFTWKVTGWFMVGWSPEFPSGEVRPLHYFGEDLLAYRDEQGELHVMEAHCRHLGTHIGRSGTVVGDCVQCPFHGWRWGPDGTNRYIPYQPERPNKVLRLRVYPVREQYDWWPRLPGDLADVPSGELRDTIEKHFLSTVFDDLQIWRYQKYVENPALSIQDAKGYMALRKWATQFYEVPA